MQQYFVKRGISSKEIRGARGGNSWSTVTVLLIEDVQSFSVYSIFYENKDASSSVCDADCCTIVTKLLILLSTYFFVFMRWWEIHMCILFFREVA
jgi:hypothetical protein